MGHFLSNILPPPQVYNLDHRLDLAHSVLNIYKLIPYKNWLKIIVKTFFKFLYKFIGFIDEKLYDLMPNALANLCNFLFFGCLTDKLE